MQIEAVSLILSPLERFTESGKDTCRNFGKHTNTMSSLVDRLDKQAEKLGSIVIPAKLDAQSF